MMRIAILKNVAHAQLPRLISDSLLPVALEMPGRPEAALGGPDANVLVQHGRSYRPTHDHPACDGVDWRGSRSPVDVARTAKGARGEDAGGLEAMKGSRCIGTHRCREHADRNIDRAAPGHGSGILPLSPWAVRLSTRWIRRLAIESVRNIRTHRTAALARSKAHFGHIAEEA